MVLNLPADKHMPCGVFGSFGWSGEAVDELQFRLKDSGGARWEAAAVQRLQASCPCFLFCFLVV